MISWFRKLIEKIYFMFPKNLIENEGVGQIKTLYFFNTKMKETYSDSEVFVIFLSTSDEVKNPNEHINNAFKAIPVYNICRVGERDFIILANKDFNYQTLNYIKDITYGYVVKRETESLSDAVSLARKFMIKRQNKVETKKKNRKTKK